MVVTDDPRDFPYAIFGMATDAPAKADLLAFVAPSFAVSCPKRD
jgi:hypothetical protein